MLSDEKTPNNRAEESECPSASASPLVTSQKCQAPGLSAERAAVSLLPQGFTNQ